MKHIKKIAFFTLALILPVFYLTFRRWHGPTNRPAIIFIHGTSNGTRKGTPELANWFAGAKAYITKENSLIPVADLKDDYVAKKIAGELVRYNPEKYSLENAYAYTWNGALSNDERRFAAQKLIELLKEKGITNIECYAHSHGGNVLMHAARLIERLGCKITIEKAVLFACPVQDETLPHLEAPCIKKVVSLFSTKDRIQILDPQKLWSKKATSFFSRKRFAANLSNTEKLKEAEIRIDGDGTQHGDFIKEPFLSRMPEIIAFLDASPNLEHVINIDTNMNTVTRLIEQPIIA